MLKCMGREEMRAADGDRQVVADKLRAALDEGRLDLHEYDERLQQTYAAKTYGELDVLLTDLPAVAPGPVVAGPAEHVTAHWLRSVWSSWLSTAGVLTAIWLVAGLSPHGLDDYWPAWVLGPWGVLLLWQTVGGLASGEPRKAAEKRERKALAKQRMRERKALEAEAATDEGLST
jgi:hypothetical protein